MTTATLAVGNRTDTAVVRPRRSLEELVDQLMAALGFKEESETQEPRGATETASSETAEPSAVRSVHEARRLQAGGGRRRGAGGAGRRGHGESGRRREARWAFSEWAQLVKRRFGGRTAPWSTARARDGPPCWLPTGDGGTLEVAAVLGMRWRPGKIVSGRSLRGLRPLTGGA